MAAAEQLLVDGALPTLNLSHHSRCCNRQALSDSLLYCFFSWRSDMVRTHDRAPTNRSVVQIPTDLSE